MITTTIYIDIVFIENLLMNYIILLTTGIIIKTKIKHGRLIIAGTVGAIYSILGYMGFIKGVSNIGLKLLLSVVIVYIAFNPQTIKKMWKDLLLFYLISFVFGGSAFALIYMIKPQEIIMKNGLFMGTYPLKTIAIGVIISFLLIMAVFAIVRNRITKKNMFCEIEFKIKGKKVRTKAMLDTGNMLKAPITNSPVVVVESILLYECMPKEILNNLEEIIGGDFQKVSEEIKNEYISKLRLIPYSSLGKTNGMLIGIKPEYLKVITEEKENKKENVIIGIYNKSLTKRGEYQALIGIELI